MNLRPYRDILPTLGPRTYVDPAATVIGDVVLGDDVSIWPGTVVRGDVNFIRIGARTNIQDGTIIHVNHERVGAAGTMTTIGADITVGTPPSGPYGPACVTCTTHWSCRLERAPMRMKLTSPRMTVPGHTDASSPSTTSPMTVAASST